MKLYRAFLLSALLLAACAVESKDPLDAVRGANLAHEHFGIDDGKGTGNGFVSFQAGAPRGFESASGYYGNWLNYAGNVFRAAPWVQTQLKLVLYVLNESQTTTQQYIQFGVQITANGAKVYPVQSYYQQGNWSYSSGNSIAGTFTSNGYPVGANAILYNNFQASAYTQPTAQSATIYITASNSSGQTGVGNLTLNAQDFSPNYSYYGSSGFVRRAVAIGSLGYLVVQIVSQGQQYNNWWNWFGYGNGNYNGYGGYGYNGY